MRTEVEIRKQLEAAKDHLKGISKVNEPGRGVWRRMKGYHDALEWVLGRAQEKKK